MTTGKARRVRRATGTADRSRVFVYLLSTYLQRIDRERRSIYGGDLELASICEAIALAAVEPLMRDPAWRERYAGLDKVVGAQGQRAINALSVAETTGIPRETARRKIKKLVALGVITQVRRGEYIMTPGFLQQAAHPQRLDQVLADTIQLINDGLDQGLWSDG
jgi:hypothetical protein